MSHFTTRLTLISCLIALCAGMAACRHQDKGEAPASPPPTVVEMGQVEKQTWEQRIKSTGDLQANQGIMLKSAIVSGGYITKINFQEGDYVKANDILFQVNPELNRMYIRAPFAGKMGLRKVDLGDYIKPGDPLVSLQDVDPIKVSFYVPQNYLNVIKVGNRIEIFSEAYKDQSIEGKVYAIDTTVNEGSRSIELRGKIPNKDERLVPGTFVEVYLYVGNQHDVLVVPQTAVSYSGTQTYVYTVQHDEQDPNKKTAVRTNVKLGERRGEDVAVEGLKEGEEIVTAGQVKLSDGAPIVTQAEFMAYMQMMQQKALAAAPGSASEAPQDAAEQTAATAEPGPQQATS